MAGNLFFSRLSFLLMVVTALSCAGAPLNRPPEKTFSAHIEDFAMEISARVREFDLDSKTIGVTTFVELDNLESSSSFGRHVSEQLASELYKLGFHIRELRQRVDVETIRTKGEFALTRNGNLLMKKFQVDALLAGSYTVVGKTLVASARIINRDTSHIVSVGGMTIDLKKHREVLSLLNRNSSGPPPVVKVYALGEGMDKK